MGGKLDPENCITEQNIDISKNLIFLKLYHFSIVYHFSILSSKPKFLKTRIHRFDIASLALGNRCHKLALALGRQLELGLPGCKGLVGT